MKLINESRLVSLVPTSAIVATLALVLTSGSALAATPSYHNGFEKDDGKYYGPTTEMFDVTRVGPGTGAASGRWYATAARNAYVFSRLGGYSSTFPTGGYTTSVDIYLDMSKNSAASTDLRFDWSSAISNTSGGHRRDFIFHAGTNPATAGQFLVSVSNNAPGNPANGLPLPVSESGWYTFQHEFTNVDGVLAVNMSVLDDHGHVLKTWILSDASDTIGDTGVVGGNRYAWLVNNDFDGLALDNVTRVKN